MDVVGERSPPFRRIALALVAMVALPLSSYVTGSTVGAFRMFTDLSRYRLVIVATSSDGSVHRVDPQTLAPHLGRDGRRIIAPAGRPIYGETAAALLPGELDDIGRLVCALDSNRADVAVTLERSSVDGPLPKVTSHVGCTR